jgi:tRNA U55 pseudouridine synthase TruB
MIEDIKRLVLVQNQVIKLRRLAAETFDRETSRRLSALADAIEQRTREADRLACAPNIRPKTVI